MNFILPFLIPKSEHKISFNDKLLYVGSCFAEEIGSLMHSHRMNVKLNPYGILFNSLSISRTIKDIINQRIYEAQDLIYDGSVWHSLNHHGRFSHPDKEQCLENINCEIREASSFLNNANWLVITLGSSWAYQNVNNNEVVANCHKLPAKLFQKVLLSSAMQQESLQETITKLKSLRPSLNIIFSVSPVRYIRDGLVENNLSKAQLVTTVNHLIAKNSNTYYFPAYELVNDVLRDYRFFKEDMVHPNEQAIQYVWSQFLEAYMDNDNLDFMNEVSSFLQFQNHRPLHPHDQEKHHNETLKREALITEKINQWKLQNKPSKS